MAGLVTKSCSGLSPDSCVVTSPEEMAVLLLLASYPAVSAVSAPLAALISGQPQSVLTAISEAIISVRALPAGDLQTFMDGLTGAITSGSEEEKLQAISVLRPFISTWSVSAGTNVTLPLLSNGTYNFTVDWGDGFAKQTISVWDSALKTHVYTEAGIKTVTITGTLTGWGFNRVGSVSSIRNISNWGSFKFGTPLGQYFHNASNLTITAQDIPSLVGTTSMSQAFRSCGALTTIPNIEKWDTSAVTDMSQMFQDVTNFNQNISGWDTAAVTNMYAMFYRASVFNQNISGWDTAAVTNMYAMFYRASVFNQDIGIWDTSNVTDMSGLFFGTTFNKDISGWNTSKVTNMGGMFQGSAFNQPINYNQATDSWNTSLVTDMSRMFFDAYNFNQPIGEWNTSKVTTMERMFQAYEKVTVFNQNISTWNVATVTVSGRSAFSSFSPLQASYQPIFP